MAALVFPDKKIVSVGLNHVSNKYSPRINVIDAAAVERHILSETNEADRILLRKSKINDDSLDILMDRTKAVYRPPSPRKARLQEAALVDSKVTGLLIGSQMSSTEQLHKKKNSQQQYLQQLQEDKERKLQEDINTENSFNLQIHGSTKLGSKGNRPPSPLRQGGLTIGQDESLMKEKKRAEARRALELNTRDIMIKEAMLRDQAAGKVGGSTAAAASKRSEASEPVTEFIIGSALTDHDVHRKKILAQRRYLAQLDQDLQQASGYDRDGEGASPVGGSSSTRGSGRSREPGAGGGLFVNKTGWTGIDIGGVSSGQTASQVDIRSKQSKQQAYRDSLDQQRIVAQRFNEEETRRANAGYDPTGSHLPYMH